MAIGKIIAPQIKQRFFTNDGFPLAFGKVYTYVAGSAGAVNKNTYQDAAGTPNANPIPLNARGECDIWLDIDTPYLFVVKDAIGNIIWTEDTISADRAFTVLGASDGADYIFYQRSAAGAAILAVSDFIDGLWYNPEHFRTPGATDQQVMLAWMAALGNGVNGEINRNYTITGVIQKTSASRFKIRGRGVITIANGTVTGDPGAGLFFYDCTEFTVEGITVDGNRANRIPASNAAHLIKLYNCRDFVLRECTAKNGTCDGIFIAATNGTGPGGGPSDTEMPKNYIVENCVATGCYRNGMSIIEGWSWVVKGGRYTFNTGSYDADHLGPNCGIDVESDNKPTWTQNRIKDGLIKKVHFEGNAGYQLQITNVNTVSNVRSEDCEFIDNRRGAAELTAGGSKLIRAYMDGWSNAAYTTWVGAPPKRGLVDIPFGAQRDIVIEDLKTVNITADATGGLKYIVFTLGGTGGEVQVIRPNIKGGGCTMEFHSDFCTVSGGIVDGISQFGAITLAGNDNTVEGVTVKNCTGFIPIWMTGAGAIAKDNKCIDNAANASGVIYGNVADCIIEGNEVRRAAAAAGCGISTSAAARRVSRNTITGYTGGAAFTLFAGTVFNRENIQNATKVTETVITP